jgi:hypothetical protein
LEIITVNPGRSSCAPARPEKLPFSLALPGAILTTRMAIFGYSRSR